MKEDIIVVKIEFFDHALGREKVIYGEVRATKIDRFETNEDSWITLTGVDIPKIDVLRISEYKEGEVSLSYLWYCGLFNRCKRICLPPSVIAKLKKYEQTSNFS